MGRWEGGRVGWWEGGRGGSSVDINSTLFHKTGNLRSSVQS